MPECDVEPDRELSEEGINSSAQQRIARRLAAAIGQDRVTIDPGRMAGITRNTLGVERRLVAVVRPIDTEGVKRVVDICRDHRLGMYPVSRGQNVGYGEKAPVLDGQVLVDLSEMSRIRDADLRFGKVVVEPGVTQRQLYEFLLERNAGFWMDATGSGSMSSVVGNTLEGGFGHTPVGNRRRLLAGLEVVLGSGEVLEAGTFPDVGPDINGLFVQSCFGIVTAAEVTLFPIPERYQSFIVRVGSEEGLEDLIDILARLRRNGTLTSLVHVANATRALVSGAKLPDDFRGTRITNREAVRYLDTPLAKAGFWTAIGGIYGSRRMVAALRADLRRAFRGIAHVQFITDRKLKALEGIVRNRWFNRLSVAPKAHLVLDATSYIHGLGRGVPSDQGIYGEMRRTEGFAQPGLFWCSPTFAAEGGAARAVVDIGEMLFARFGFELPITITFVTPGRAIATMSCCFDAGDDDQRRLAHDLLSELHQELERNGIATYREGILGMHRITYHLEGKATTLSRLKRALDPEGIVSPGRYGIDQRPSGPRGVLHGKGSWA